MYKAIFRLAILAVGYPVLFTAQAHAQACYQTSVLAPTPFLGNHGEVIKTADGALYEVVGSYEYMYSYSPKAVVCPAIGKMIVGDKTLNVTPLQIRNKTKPKGSQRKAQESQPEASGNAPITVVYRVPRCDYFIADGPQGYYVLQWFGGYDPSTNDGIYGDLRGFGFKTVLYSNGQEGKVWVDNYLMNKERVVERFKEKCDR